MKKLIFLTLSALLLTSCGGAEETSVSVDTKDLYFGPEFLADLSPVDEGAARGTAVSSLALESGTYTVIVAFEDLPSLAEGFFYEGWLVRTEGELSVLSTGKVENNMNFYTSDVDLTDHTQYILTLEPDDGDPAPADHVLEGTFTQTN